MSVKTRILFLHENNSQGQNIRIGLQHIIKH